MEMVRLGKWYGRGELENSTGAGLDGSSRSGDGAAQRGERGGLGKSRDVFISPAIAAIISNQRAHLNILCTSYFARLSNLSQSVLCCVVALINSK